MPVIVSQHSIVFYLPLIQNYIAEPSNWISDAANGMALL